MRFTPFVDSLLATPSSGNGFHCDDLIGQTLGTSSALDAIGQEHLQLRFKIIKTVLKKKPAHLQINCHMELIFTMD